jgi:L-ascorbate metabolism protein UlaG (beta-lactamase superfamily)
MIRLAVALGLMFAAPAIAQTPETLEIRHVANMGVLVSQGERKVLFDAFGSQSYDTYRTPSEADLAAMIAGTGDFAGADLAVFSHRHGDHFDASDAADYLTARSGRVIAAPAQTLALIRAELERREAPGAWIPVGGDGIGFLCAASDCAAQAAGDAIAIGGRELFHMADIENLGVFLQIGDLKIMHLGDTQPRVADFSVLDGIETDVLLFPYWFAEMAEGRAQLQNRFRDARQIALHIPERVNHAQARAVFGEGGYLIEPGQTITIWDEGLPVRDEGSQR